MMTEDNKSCFGEDWGRLYRDIQSLPAHRTRKKTKAGLQNDLIDAIRNGDTETVKGILNGGLDPNFFHDQGFFTVRCDAPFST